jgi:secreted Zn-dependent insulinase-like peptidase
MPAPTSLTTQSLILPNGLRVVLCHAPRMKRCAAALRVSAGSHDVPQDWPGLAHFLEHLFFLGTSRFPAADNLMAFVQRHGGQVNASTRERATDFFFELPQSVFADGLERLCDMLAHPRMAFDEQLREREVLHAEFIAWTRDEAARNQMKLLEPVSVNHPLRWFHAGNRYSLLVPRPTFQQALQDFYQRFYQAGQMTLSLAGPQSLAELKALAERFGGMFAEGAQVDQVAPPRLMEASPNAHAITDSFRMHLIFACEDLPEGATEAVGYFCFWLGNSQAGGLVAELKARGLAESLNTEVLYQFGGQVLIDIGVVLKADFAGKRAPTNEARSPAGTDERRSPVGARLPAIKPAQSAPDQITALFLHWLSFFKTNYPVLRNEYELLKQKRLDVTGALTLARHYSDAHSSSGLSDSGASALDVLIGQLLRDAELLTSRKTEIRPEATWRLPQPNVFLRTAQLPASNCPALPALSLSDALPSSSGEGAVYLRWTLKCPHPLHWQMLNDSLKSLTEDAQQAGVNLAFSAMGRFWQLKIAGLTDPVPAVLEAALKLLSDPDLPTRARYARPPSEPSLIPIRQLLKVLPDYLLMDGTCGSDAQESLQSVWQTASWTGLALGFSTKHQNSLRQVLRNLPGIPDTHPPQPPAIAKSKRWETELSASSEDAVLVFCPTPSDSIADEACWRLLAHLAQTPFYQRLRVELQLGYAVFSGFRQIAGQSGILFGVQSPSAPAAELAQHIEHFIAGMPTLIASVDVPLQGQILAAQLDLHGMETEKAAELLWQAHLAGHDNASVDRMKHYLSNLHETDWLAAIGKLTQASTGWLYLANRSRPGGPWPMSD